MRDFIGCITDVHELLHLLLLHPSLKLALLLRIETVSGVLEDFLGPVVDTEFNNMYPHTMYPFSQYFPQDSQCCLEDAEWLL